MDAAIIRELHAGPGVRLLTASYFLATKFEAFHRRGKGEFTVSHDLEDLVFVIDGRATVVEKVQAEMPSLPEYLRTQINALPTAPKLIHVLPGYLLPDAARVAPK